MAWRPVLRLRLGVAGHRATCSSTFDADSTNAVPLEKSCIPGTAPTSAHLAAFLVFSGGESVRFGLSPRLVVPFELRTRLFRQGLVPISKSVPILHTFRRGDDFDLRWRFQTGDPQCVEGVATVASAAR
jgi:hypothetical protein